VTENEAKLLATIMLLRAAIKTFLDGYASRSMKQEGIALKKLRDALEETV